MVSQRLFISKCPSQRDPLFPNANASVLSLLTSSPENAPEDPQRVESDCERPIVFNEAGHIVRKKSEFNNFSPYPNTLNVIIVSYLNS